MKSIRKAHEKCMKSAAFHDERPLARNYNPMFLFLRKGFPSCYPQFLLYTVVD